MFTKPPDDDPWGGSFGPLDDEDEGELSEGETTFRFHDATEGEALIVRLPNRWGKGKFRGKGELRPLY
jgi:hypothetical protein